VRGFGGLRARDAAPGSISLLMDVSAKVLSGRNALIIGGGGEGIGRAITRGLARAGSAVAVADADPKRAEEAAAEIAAAGATSVGLAGDVRSPDDIDGFVEHAAQELGGLDVLVTVVGGQLAFVPAARLHELRDEDWRLMFELNLHYVARAVRAALLVFLAQGRGGTIVSVGSIAGQAGSPMQAAYGAAKAGLASLARSVAAEYSREGIRMNVVTAGPIATPVARAAQAGALDWIPMGRAGEASEVADAAVFLASPASSYITGQSLVLDGGATAAGPFPSWTG
jgi:3-oxoacyl-[acyl-carrier protein] reductase